MSVSSGDDRYSSSSSRTGTTVGDGAAMAFLPSSEPSVTFLPPGATGLASGPEVGGVGTGVGTGAGAAVGSGVGVAAVACEGLSCLSPSCVSRAGASR